MPAETHPQIASFIWGICNLLRGPYKRNEYRKVILPLTVLRRFDCILAPTKAAVLKEHANVKAKPENIIRHRLCSITGHAFYNLSKLDLPRLLDDPNQLAPNLNSYINGFSPNVRAIMERFDFGTQQHMLAKMRAPQDGGSRLAIVFNGSPLFTGDAGGGESNIRQWIIENDWLEAIVALPEQLFYNTGISTDIKKLEGEILAMLKEVTA
ncbi:MAG: type I restriction-modification system subunit M N-terminal domain-containing protein [Planctomycetes bacterium]|nr:type I restriction-modification system subunit M N-terminal domain-containing protein [Planctomycetota bacterium]